MTQGTVDNYQLGIIPGTPWFERFAPVSLGDTDDVTWAIITPPVNTEFILERLTISTQTVAGPIDLLVTRAAGSQQGFVGVGVVTVDAFNSPAFTWAAGQAMAVIITNESGAQTTIWGAAYGRFLDV